MIALWYQRSVMRLDTPRSWPRQTSPAGFFGVVLLTGRVIVPPPCFIGRGGGEGLLVYRG
jgi:hypothetical protein